jgi:uncharacterized protein (DUF983 family)
MGLKVETKLSYATRRPIDIAEFLVINLIAHILMLITLLFSLNHSWLWLNLLSSI